LPRPRVFGGVERNQIRKNPKILGGILVELGVWGGFWRDGVGVLLSYSEKEKTIFVIPNAAKGRKRPKLSGIKQELKNIKLFLIPILLKNNRLTHSHPLENTRQ